MKLVASDGQIYELTKDVTRVGRKSDNDIVIQDKRFSGYHFTITRQPNGILIVDNDSTNGTYINGERLSAPRFIQSGDEIRVGPMLFFIEFDPLPLAETGVHDPHATLEDFKRATVERTLLDAPDDQAQDEVKFDPDQYRATTISSERAHFENYQHPSRYTPPDDLNLNIDAAHRPANLTPAYTQPALPHPPKVGAQPKRRRFRRVLLWSLLIALVGVIGITFALRRDDKAEDSAPAVISTAELSLTAAFSLTPEITPDSDPSATLRPSLTPQPSPTSAGSGSELILPQSQNSATPQPRTTSAIRAATATPAASNTPRPPSPTASLSPAPSLTASPSACNLTNAQNVNKRAGPGITFDTRGVMRAGEVNTANGQARGVDGFIWWRLTDNTWVRSDVVQTTGDCASLPTVNP